VDIQTRKVRKIPANSNAIAFSPDGALLAFERDRSLRLWDIRTGQEILSLTSDNFSGLTAIVFSPDGTIVGASSAGYYIVLWEVKTGRKLTVLDTTSVSSLAFSPDGTLLASGHSSSGLRDYIYMWGVQ